MTERILIRGGHLISMDPRIGDQPGTDILIEDGTIVAIGPHIGIALEELAQADIIDAANRIVLPGFVDTHRHTWQTCLRGIAPDLTLDDYRAEILDAFAPHYRPEDVYAGNLAGALECLDTGITTLVDWSDITSTPDHADAAIRALSQAGIRAQYAYGTTSNTSADVRRVREEHFATVGGLLTMALAARGPGFCNLDELRAQWEIADELDLPIMVQVGMGRLGGRYAMVEQLDKLGLLREGTAYVHGSYLSEQEWLLIVGSGGNISIAAQAALQMGHGWPPIMRAVAYGLTPALATGPVTTVPGDPFTQMRAAFAAERSVVTAQCWEFDTPVPDNLPTARDMLTMATINGAKLAGLEATTGSLTPGKRADIVVIDATAPNVAPLIDPVAAVVLAANTSNVETVILDGVIRKRDGRLLADTGRARRLVERSRDHLLRARARGVLG